MVKAERMIKKFNPQFPWSLILVTANLELSIWKLIKSELKTTTFHANKPQQLTSRLYHLDNTYPEQISTHERQNMNLINNKLKKWNKTLKDIQRNSRTIREDYLNQKMKETKIDGNKAHYKYVSNSIIIEHQHQCIIV